MRVPACGRPSKDNSVASPPLSTPTDSCYRHMALAPHASSACIPASFSSWSFSSRVHSWLHPNGGFGDAALIGLHVARGSRRCATGETSGPAVLGEVEGLHLCRWAWAGDRYGGIHGPGKQAIRSGGDCGGNCGQETHFHSFPSLLSRRMRLGCSASGDSKNFAVTSRVTAACRSKGGGERLLRRGVALPRRLAPFLPLRIPDRMEDSDAWRGPMDHHGLQGSADKRAVLALYFIDLDGWKNRWKAFLRSGLERRAFPQFMFTVTKIESLRSWAGLDGRISATTSLAYEEALRAFR